MAYRPYRQTDADRAYREEFIAELRPSSVVDALLFALDMDRQRMLAEAVQKSRPGPNNVRGSGR